MHLLLSFLPILAWWLFEQWVGPGPALAIGLGLGVAVLAFRWRRGELVPFDAAVLGIVLVVGLAKIAWPATIAPWSGVLVNGGLAAYVAATVLAGRPYTIAYARARTDPAHWHTPVFRRINRDISTAWAVLFALFALFQQFQVDVFGPDSPLPIILKIALIAAAVALSERYGDWAGARAAKVG